MTSELASVLRWSEFQALIKEENFSGVLLKLNREFRPEENKEFLRELITTYCQLGILSRVLADVNLWKPQSAIMRGVELPDFVCTVPDGVTRLSWHVFESARLKEIRLPETLEFIHDWAFYECSLDEPLVIPASVSRIQQSAFVNSNIPEIIYEGTVEQWEHRIRVECTCPIICIDGRIQ